MIAQSRGTEGESSDMKMFILLGRKNQKPKKNIFSPIFASSENLCGDGNVYV
jgi:hypothetical protein